MTFRSEHQGYIRGISGFAAGVSQPVDTSALRDGLINNVNQLTTECTQTRVALTLPVGAYFEQTSPSTEQYQLVDRLPILGFPATHRGRTLDFVAHLRASISAAGTASFRVKLGIFGDDAESPAVGSTIKNVSTVTTTSTSATNLSPSILYIPATVIAERATDPESPYAWLPGIASLDGNGTRSYGKSLWLQVEVWAKTSVVTSKPRVHGLYVREYTG